MNTNPSTLPNPPKPPNSIFAGSLPASRNPFAPPTPLERYRGALLGLAVGDALGTTVEFQPRGRFTPVTDMVGGGPFALAPGQWTDDTSMALCLGESLLAVRGFDALDQMQRFLRWREDGYLSSTGECFDIGVTVSRALDRFRATGNPMAGDPDPRMAGNGALMRLAPVVMFYAEDEELTLRMTTEHTKTTHAAAEAIDCSGLFALQLRMALQGANRAEVLSVQPREVLAPQVARLAAGAYRLMTRDAIRGSGYCVESLEAALWCFAHSGSFSEAVLAAVNLGDDADTTAAICGQLAGAFYGVRGIPTHWMERLAMRDQIDAQASRLFSEGWRHQWA